MNQKPPNAYAGMRQSASILAQDALRLADLQLQLLGLDVAEFWQRARFGLVFCISGIAVMLGALPVMLLAFAEWLQLNTTLTSAGSRGIVAGTALILAGLGLWISVRQLTRAGESLQRSQAELRTNMAWLRSVINGDDD